ncbi:MAG: tetratricopeptide repeat protein [Gaiellaceae bacterium]
MPELPSGTVTFLFMDIEGSTRLLHELGDAYAAALAEHRDKLRSAFAANDGVEVDTQGDAFFVAFHKASDALAAAASGRDALAGGPIRVRMGVHTGEPLVTEEGYVGIDVHRAARIAAAGHGGQVLVSQSTRDLADVDSLRDLGEHRLKDLTAPERIYQLGDGDFAPLKSLNATNLPIAGTPLVGRGRELAELQDLFSHSARLVTVTGPGGTGKTRLSLQVGAELVEQFPGGVFFVQLAGVRQAELVSSTIAATLGLHDLNELRDRRTLLVMDNFEHVLDAAPVITDLLAIAPKLKVITTSRAPLRIDGEIEYPLDSLPEADAVELLTDRARAVRPDFTPDEATREICRRLDGLPLALELAASRLRSLGSQALLERLDRRLPVLTGGRRDAPERQRTLRATIEWSYDLLPPELRPLFARLAVFATFTLEAAEDVAGATFDDVDALVEASLVKPLRDDRFFMLETIREYAFEQLEAHGESEKIRERHAEFFLQLAQRANLNEEADGAMLHSLVIPEQNNIRAALEWATAMKRGELGLGLAIALENFWVTTDSVEGRRWIEGLLLSGPSAPSTIHALALRCLGNCATIAGMDDGELFYEQSLAEFRELGDELRTAIGLHRVAAHAVRRGDDARARQLADESLAGHRRIGFQKGEASIALLLGDLERRAGEPERALGFYERSMALARETGFTWWEKHTLFSQALVYFALGRPDQAAERLRSALELAHRMGDRVGQIDSLALLARAAVERHDYTRAGWLWGAVEAESERGSIAGWDPQNQHFEPVRELLGSDAFETGRAAGLKADLKEAVEAALAGDTLSIEVPPSPESGPEAR